MSFPTGDDIVSVLGYNAGLLAMLVAMALMLKPESEYSRRLLGGITALAITTYLVWRVTQTLPPFELSIGGLWPYLFMAAELMAILYSLATILILMKNRDNTALVEGALQSNRVTGNWPSVDVFICTYNEPINVLEKSILPALAMDYPNYRVFVCDDTRREHLREYCENVGANYITRPDNLHAKAGNLDNAYRRTHDAEAGDLIMVLDADFAPQRHFLRRVTGLFNAPEVGLVQTPQFYYNNDPVQTAFGLSDAFVDDQRVFFDVLQPAKDAVGCAFCVGTSFVVRRSMIDLLGGFPTGVLSEDMWLSYKLMEKGYETRWLNERLSVGLSAESVSEYITQRTRWCLGTIQIGCMPDGPLRGGRYTLLQRLHYLHGLISWLSKPFIPLMLLAPVLYWYFGLPAYHADELAFLRFGLPALLCFWVYSTWVSRGRTLPILTEVTHTVTAVPVTLTLLSALRNPFGKPFKVTDKGGDHSAINVNVPTATLFGSLSLTLSFILLFNLLGPGAQAEPAPRDIFNMAWAIVAILISTMALAICFERPRDEGEVMIHVDVEGAMQLGDRSLPLQVDQMSAETAITAPLGWDPRTVPPEGGNLTLRVPGMPPLDLEHLSIASDGRLVLKITPSSRQDAVRGLFSAAPENVARCGRLFPALAQSIRHLLWA